MALLMALKRAGGIDPRMLPDMGQENGFRTNRKLPGLVRRGGFTEDGLLEWMQQNGYLHNQQISEADEYQPGGAHELARELVNAALSGDTVVQIGSEEQFYSERANREYEDYMQQEQETKRKPGRPRLPDSVRKIGRPQSERIAQALALVAKGMSQYRAHRETKCSASGLYKAVKRQKANPAATVGENHPPETQSI